MFDPSRLKDLYRLSPTQKGMLFHTLKDENNDTYFEQMVFLIEGELHVPFLEESFNRLIEKYDVLRTVFLHSKMKEPTQVVLKERRTSVSYEDISHLDQEEQSLFLTKYKFQDRQKGFNLQSDMLIRLAVLKMGPSRFQMLLSHHHILMDGWCMGIILNDLFKYYAHLKQGVTIPHEKGLPYSTYIQWLEEQDEEEAIRYWSKFLEGYSGVKGLPYTWSAQEPTSFIHKEVHFSFNEEMTRELSELAMSEQVTVNTVFQTIWGIMLQKLNQTDDVVFGSVVSGRPADIPEVEKMVGLFINTIPVRITSTGNDTFQQLMGRTQEKALASNQYDYVSLAEIQGGEQVFDHIIAFENFPVVTDDFEENPEQKLGFRIHGFEAFEQTNYTLSVQIHSGEKISGKIIFNGEAYNSDWMENIPLHLQEIAAQIIGNPEMNIEDIQLMPEKEIKRIIGCNSNVREFPREETIHSLFEGQAEKTPENLALALEGEGLTYKELNEMANQFAHSLLKHGVKRGQTVGLMAERSFAMIASMLGILKAGAAYLPIDPGYPAERIQYMVEDSGTQLVLLQGGSLPGTYGGKVLTVEEALLESDSSNPGRKSGPEDLAYVVYTSGSTGMPKGNLTTHRNVIRTIINNGYLEVEETDRLLQLSNYAFDGSTFDIYAALLHGARLVLVPKDTVTDAVRLSRLIREEQVTVSFMTTALFNTLVDVDLECLKGLRKLLFGGEMVSVKHVRRAYRAMGEGRLIHVYGPTETTVFATACPVTESMCDLHTIPIGRPISNTSGYVVSSSGQLLPEGVPGELAIGGAGVSRGYLNRPDLNHERFVDNPYIPGDVFYKTGDLVRWLPDGNLEYLGRIDQQVKIRGHRVELGELETRLLEFPGVREAHAIAYQDLNGHSYLCAYIVTEGIVQTEEIRGYVAQRLPDYMLPTYIVELEKLPLNPNGKVDKRQLPEPKANMEKEKEYAPPVTETEGVLASLFEDILGVRPVGVHDNFFELGGHSLKAMILSSRIHKQLEAEVPIKAIFSNPTVKQLASIIAASSKNEYRSIKKTSKRPFYPVSAAQKRMYTAQKLEEAKGGTSYNIPIVVEINGNLEIDRVYHAFSSLMNRHESLRTAFLLKDGVLVQEVWEEVELPFKSAQGEPVDLPEIIKGFIKPFDLSKAPLLRVKVVQVSEDRHILMMDMHHIISDGVSTNLLLKDFVELYQGKKLSELRIQYKDFAVWQQEESQVESMKKQELYWLNALSGELPVLELPTDFTRPAIKQFEGETFGFRVDCQLVRRLKEISSEEESTLFMILLAAYNILLSKYSGQEDIIVGSPIAGRNHADLEEVIGVFINVLPLRNQPVGTLTFREFLLQVREQVLQSYENADYPYEELLENLQLQRDFSRNPLFDTMLNLQNIEMKGPEIPGLSFNSYSWDYNNSKYDINLDIAETEQGELYVSVEYSTSLFTRGTMERLKGHFLHLLQQITEDPDQKLGDMVLVTKEEKHQLLNSFNETQRPFPQDKTIHELFEEQVRKTPEHVALEFKEKQLTYRELNARANQLAGFLRERGTGREELVGIMVDRSLEMIVGILGVLKAGGAYVPLDPSYPIERIRYILEDSRIERLLTQSSLNVPDGFTREAILIDQPELYRGACEDLDPVSTADDLAYVIYTSGSTGKPKGVLIEHRGVSNLQLMAETYGIREGSRVLQFASYSFDASVGDIFHTLLSGATLYICDQEVFLSGQEFVRWLEEKSINSIPFIPPSMLKALPYAELRDLHTLSTSGEALPMDLVETWGRNRTFLNAYGPTETVVDATIGECRLGMNKVVIGKPIANKRVYILNKELQLQPIGVPGELFIGGEGIARGYLNRPDMTSERFIVNPYDPEERIYRTGDVVRWLPDGNIEFLGRNDDQVKVRGYRVELGEIETKLMGHASVREAVVVLNDRNLCAYIVSDRDWTGAEIRRYLQEELPGYMIPSYFTRLESLPLTPNGKVDKKALPKPDLWDEGVEYTAPLSEREKLLADVWKEVLRVDRVGIHDNFFELGGDSIKAIQIAARLNESNLKLSMMEMFKNPTIYELSPFLESLLTEAEQTAIEGSVPLTPIQHWFFEQRFEKPEHFNQSMMLFRKEGWEPEKVKNCFRRLSEHHDALRIVFPSGSPAQFNRGTQGMECTVRTFDFRSSNNPAILIEKEANSVQGSIRLADGPLFRLAVFHTAEGDHLLIVIHHLIIDGVSWRILLDDFNRIYEKGENALPAKTTSYQRWANSLVQYGSSRKGQNEAKYWRNIQTKQVPALPMDYPYSGGNLYEELEVEGISLGQNQTNMLLTDAHKAFQTEINDLLLSALFLTIQEWTGENTLAVTLEGHGREDLMEGMDLSRTVGWFTSIFPVVFEIGPTEIGSVIKVVKETLRKVPNKGAGYGVLKYLSSSAVTEKTLSPEICFNYLGTFEGDGDVTYSRMPMGLQISGRNHQDHLLEWNGMVVDGVLQVTISYNPKVFDKSTIKMLGSLYRDHLVHLMEFCCGKEETELTPSDFSESDLTLDELDDIFGVLESKK
ncbi:non-ribosomal peptide synthetase [Mesobacillus foraminis]|uniref:Surfactin family lipopeptide synthetase A n=1 Tax=Mesobacillus foraminis TaxID=279826 RepID=A0A4R2AUF3_9BACI|nr:non-ribosomal peptide synthetase [Mesobacillus foraminis]TCN17537.1 surfactin family lipopeptide synthetase A [Mesobacillus foraminis]